MQVRIVEKKIYCAHAGQALKEPIKDCKKTKNGGPKKFNETKL